MNWTEAVQARDEIRNAKAEIASLREKLAQAERKGWNDAIEKVAVKLKGEGQPGYAAAIRTLVRKGGK